MKYVLIIICILLIGCRPESLIFIGDTGDNNKGGIYYFGLDSLGYIIFDTAIYHSKDRPYLIYPVSTNEDNIIRRGGGFNGVCCWAMSDTLYMSKRLEK